MSSRMVADVSNKGVTRVHCTVANLLNEIDSTSKFNCYRRISLQPMKKKKTKILRGLKIYFFTGEFSLQANFHYRRMFITGVSLQPYLTVHGVSGLNPMIRMAVKMMAFSSLPICTMTDIGVTLIVRYIYISYVC